MKLVKTLAVILLSISSLNIFAFTQPPVKTAVIKAAGAENATTFFSTTKAVAFSIFKAGTAEESAVIISKLKENVVVDLVIAGKVTGDYTAINVSLKEVKDKSFWMTLLKSAGINNIKINNHEPVEVEKL